MKRAHVFGRTLLALVIAASLAACGGGDSGSGETARVVKSTFVSPSQAIPLHRSEFEGAGIPAVLVQCFEYVPPKPDPAAITGELPYSTTGDEVFTGYYYVYEISSRDLSKANDIGYQILDLSSFNLTPRSCSE